MSGSVTVGRNSPIYYIFLPSKIRRSVAPSLDHEKLVRAYVWLKCSLFIS